MTVYGLSKLAGECYARGLLSNLRIPDRRGAAFQRLRTTFPPRGRQWRGDSQVHAAVYGRTTDGSSRDGYADPRFTYVADTAQGIIMAGLSDVSVGQTINLGNGNEIAIAIWPRSDGRSWISPTRQ